jgi:uncharacterized membrane protein
VAGSSLYVLYQIGAAPETLAPLFSSPTVYVTTAILGGATWLVASRFAETEVVLAAVGIAISFLPVGVSIATAKQAGTLAPGWSVFGTGIALVFSLGLWFGFARYQPEPVAEVGAAGGIAVFGHVLDGVSTSIGVDVLHFGEQSPLSALLLDVGAALPTEPILGSGWVFLVVKAALAIGLVWISADLVRDDPVLGNGLLLMITGVGLGPATHNLLLFAVASPAGV